MSALPQTAPESPLVLRNDRDGVATLTLNRPTQRNALSTALMAALQDELDRIKEDTSVKVVVIAGAGPGFCGGHDLKEMRANPGRQAYEALFAQCSKLMLTITRLPKPVIAKVHAVAAAAGCQLVATCDLAVAGQSARFAVNGVNIGLFCSTPMVALTRAIGRKPAMEMLLTGDLIDAETARRYGLVNQVVPDAELDAAVDALARKIVAKSPVAVAIGKEAFYKQAELDLEEAYRYASEVMTRNMLARDTERGIDAFIAKQPMPKWEGR
ncbi:MAG TPA: enoyl-CoA hydratase [Alphaproteobacteria bacterium]|nr:enoyl-CoA hydratase [Alphaproteobacteria bacterium]